MANFRRLQGGGLVIRLFTPTDYDISIEDSTNNALFQKNIYNRGAEKLSRDRD